MRTLYHQPVNPFCRKLRLQLSEKGLDFELVEEREWERREELLALDPAGRLPVLVDEDDTIVASHAAIAEYLEERYPETPMLPGSPAERAEIRRLVAWFDDKLNEEVTVNLVHEKVDRRYMSAELGGGGPDMAAVRAGLHNMRYHLDYIGFLMDHRHWLAGETLTLADLAAGAHLSCLDYVGDVPWTQYPAAKGWYQRLKSRPSFRAILADHIPGMPPPRVYADLDF